MSKAERLAGRPYAFRLTDVQRARLDRIKPRDRRQFSASLRLWLDVALNEWEARARSTKKRKVE